MDIPSFFSDLSFEQIAMGIGALIAMVVFRTPFSLFRTKTVGVHSEQDGHNEHSNFIEIAVKMIAFFAFALLFSNLIYSIKKSTDFPIESNGQIPASLAPYSSVPPSSIEPQPMSQTTTYLLVFGLFFCFIVFTTWLSHTSSVKRQKQRAQFIERAIASFNTHRLRLRWNRATDTPEHGTSCVISSVLVGSMVGRLESGHVARIDQWVIGIARGRGGEDGALFTRITAWWSLSSQVKTSFALTEEQPTVMLATDDLHFTESEREAFEKLPRTNELFPGLSGSSEGIVVGNAWVTVTIKETLLFMPSYDEKILQDDKTFTVALPAVQSFVPRVAEPQAESQEES